MQSLPLATTGPVSGGDSIGIGCGAVTVRGVAKSLDCLGTSLSFTFSSDQSCINQLFPDQRELELNPESKT